MDRSAVIELVREEPKRDVYGVWKTEQTKRDLFCQVDSVTRAEFFDGGRNGLNPEYKFTMFFGDYHGEDTLIYENRAYSIYRVFHGRNDTVELYAERKGGTNGKERNA